MLEKQGRHPGVLPVVHFADLRGRISKLVTHVFAEGDQYLDSDVVFGVRDSLVRNSSRSRRGLRRTNSCEIPLFFIFTTTSACTHPSGKVVVNLSAIAMQIAAAGTAQAMCSPRVALRF